MRFSLHHDLDLPLGAVEEAFVSPLLLQRLAAKLARVDEVRELEHRLEDERLVRAWFFQANVKVPAFAAKHVTRERMQWEERTIYDRRAHAGTFRVTPAGDPTWQRYFEAHGTYALERLGEARTRRAVHGELALNVPLFSSVGERLIAGEMKRSFEAEAEALRELATV